MKRSNVFASLLLAACTEAEPAPVVPEADADVAPRDASRVELDAGAPDLDAHIAVELDAMPRVDACAHEASAQRVAPAVIEHACLHGSDGPFRVVTGAPAPESAPDVSRAHTLFTVLGAAGETVHVRYEPDAGGDHVLFLAGAELTTARQGAMSLAPERAEADCAVLPVMYVLPLVDAQPVELALRAREARIALVLESLAPWAGQGWSDACGAPLPSVDAGSCRSSGPCSSDDECCSYCHDYDHCH